MTDAVMTEDTRSVQVPRYDHSAMARAIAAMVLPQGWSWEIRTREGEPYDLEGGEQARKALEAVTEEGLGDTYQPQNKGEVTEVGLLDIRGVEHFQLRMYEHAPVDSADAYLLAVQWVKRARTEGLDAVLGLLMEALGGIWRVSEDQFVDGNRDQVKVHAELTGGEKGLRVVYEGSYAQMLDTPVAMGHRLIGRLMVGEVSPAREYGHRLGLPGAYSVHVLPVGDHVQVFDTRTVVVGALRRVFDKLKGELGALARRLREASEAMPSKAKTPAPAYIPRRIS